MSRDLGEATTWGHNIEAVKNIYPLYVSNFLNFLYVPERGGRVSGRDPFFYRTKLVAWQYKGTKDIPKQERYGKQSIGLTRAKAGKRGSK